MTGGMSDTEGSTDGDIAGSWGRCDKHCHQNTLSMTVEARGVPGTHIDSPNPSRFFLGTKHPPLSPYSWLYTGAFLVRTRNAQCGPKNDKSDGEDSKDEHSWAIEGYRTARRGSCLFIAIIRDSAMPSRLFNRDYLGCVR